MVRIVKKDGFYTIKIPNGRILKLKKKSEAKKVQTAIRVVSSKKFKKNLHKNGI